jgi:phage recombination protein Bet
MPDANLIATMAQRFNLEPEEFKRVIKSTCGLKDAKDEEFLAFLMIAHEHRLNPLTREIYAFSKSGGGIQGIVGVDGWYKKANEHPAFDGLEFEDVLQGGQLVAVTARVFRKDRSHPTEVTEYMRECKRNTEPWNRWPARMLRHKAAIQAIRIAFNLAGLIDPDEAERYVEMQQRTLADDDIQDDLPRTSRVRSSPASGAAAVSTESPPEDADAPPTTSEGRKKRSAAPPPQISAPPEPPADETITEEESDKLIKQGDIAGYSASQLRKYVQTTYQVGDLTELRKSQAAALSAFLMKTAAKIDGH